MRTVLYLSALRKLWSKIDPVSTLRSFALITAPARASLMCSTLTTSSSWPSISNIVPLRKSLVEINQELHREQIALEAKAGDHTSCRTTGNSFRTEFLSSMNVGDVDLHGRYAERLDAIEKSERVMRERARIDDNAERARRFLLEEVDDLAFIVALVCAYLHFQLLGFRAHQLHQVGERPRAVNVRLSLSQQVQIRPVDEQDSFHAT